MAFGLSAEEPLHFAVLSPHLDDGVLSLGAAIAAAVRSGHDVSVVTVFGGNPESTAAAGRWDGRAGFTTAGAATQTRREEDRRACELVGARSVWLPFEDDQYADGRDGDEVWGRVSEALDGADAVLLPGRPLIHPDHLWVARLAAAGDLQAGRVGYYAELPYNLWSGAARRAAPSSIADVPITWVPVHVTVGARLAKWRACGAYSSQLPWLGRGFQYRRALLHSRLGGERVAWQSS